MNTDFRLSVGIFEHPKVQKLQRRLGDGGVLSFLRLLRFTAQNRPDGDLHGMDCEDVAIAGGFQGEPEDFCQMLLTLGLLDRTETGMIVHDWAQHNPWASEAQKRSDVARNAAAVRWNKEQNTQGSVQQCSSNAPAMPEHGNSNAPILSYPILSYPILAEERKDGDVTSQETETQRNGYATVTSPLRNGATVQDSTVQDITKESEGKAAARPAPKVVKIPIPTEEECLEYFTERKRPELSAGFYDYWQSVGWKRKGAVMCDWKASVRTWITRQDEMHPPGHSSPGRTERKAAVRAFVMPGVSL